MDENKRVVLRTYGNAWEFDRKIYSAGDFRLPFAINMSQAMYFFVGLAFVFLLTRIIPPLQHIPGIVLYIAIPFVIMKLLTRVKFHGKPTTAWIKGFFHHLSNPTQLERFKAVEKDREGTFTNVPFRH